jgi:hypothetical protein
MPLTNKQKRQLFDTVLNEGNPFGLGEGRNIVDFCSLIWDLEAMPSTDGRFKNAFGDLYQHTVNNDDWEMDYLFTQRLNLLGDEGTFYKFIETIVSPEIRSTEDDILTYVLLINSIIESGGLQLALVEYSSDGNPIYQVKEKKDDDDTPFDIAENRIPFFVEIKPSGNSSRFSSHSKPQEYPAFVLAFNSGWDDYGANTYFDLFFYRSKDERFKIGAVKIMSDSDVDNTASVIQNKFYKLDPDFCSVGQDISYYKKLKEELQQHFQSALFALRDVAFFPTIQERFEKHPRFINSLVRYNENERLMREARYEIDGVEPKSFYAFTYRFRPPYADVPIDVSFEFNNDTDLPNRIYAIIGKNGTGKTQLIASLPKLFSQKDIESFHPRIPLFSKVIADRIVYLISFLFPKRRAPLTIFIADLKTKMMSYYPKDPGCYDFIKPGKQFKSWSV